MPTILDWAKFIMQVRESQRHGNFVMPPLTPEQKAMWDRVNRMLDNTPSQTAYTPILAYDLGHPATLDINALKRGDVGFTPGQHMSYEDLSKIISGAAKPSGTTPPPTSTPTSAGAPTNGVAGDPFGHMTSPAGSSGDPFGNWPDPSGTAHNVTWDDIKRYGPQAVNAVNAIISATPGMALTAAWNLAKRALHIGDENKEVPTLPLRHNDVSGGTLEPNGQSFGSFYGPMRYRLSIDGHPILQTTPQQLAGQTFLSNQMRGLQNNGAGTPEGQGIGQPGFGYGLNYDDFYGGNGDPSARIGAPGYGTPFGRGGSGQRV